MELDLLLLLCTTATGMTSCVSKQKRVNHQSKHNVYSLSYAWLRVLD
jgi:membrane-associated PAP2 superfamily phosphatase